MAKTLGFWESFQWSIWKVKAFFGDKDAGIHADSLTEVVAGSTEADREINTIVDSENVAGPRIPFFSDLADAVQNSVKGVGGILKNLPMYVMIAIVFVGIYLVLMGKQGKKVVG